MTGGLYVRDGSRFVLYDARAQDTPPIPVPTPNGPSPDCPVVEVRPGHWQVYAPRCEHGHFARWARNNCPGCQR